ncbi:Sorting nexin-29 [Trichoplax sp. H2]|nr:Sorting nexin-29 [Trichoplax sp. H2]|eukprot:RDD39862.1 Sorting nexin-29 [Trichoplax sp. H2]
MDRYESERKHLRDRLLDAIKQCQIRFKEGQDIATDNDSTVICLCIQLEAVLQHGLKVIKKKDSFAWPVKNLMSYISPEPEPEPCFWNWVKKYLSELELSRLDSLTNISSDIGRGRAWLRCMLNERCLEKFFGKVVADPSIIRKFYESYAFMLDTELNSLLLDACAGLSSIVFAITSNNTQLNSANKLTAVSSTSASPPPSVLKENVASKTQHAATNIPVAATVKRKKKRQKQTATISPANTIDEDQDSIISFSPSNNSYTINESNGTQQLQDSLTLNTSTDASSTFNDEANYRNTNSSISSKNIDLITNLNSDLNDAITAASAAMEAPVLADTASDVKDPLSDANKPQSEELDSSSVDKIVNDNITGQQNLLKDADLTPDTYDTEFRSLDSLYTKQMAWNSVFQSAFVDPSLDLSAMKESSTNTRLSEQIDPVEESQQKLKVSVAEGDIKGTKSATTDIAMLENNNKVIEAKPEGDFTKASEPTNIILKTATISNLEGVEQNAVVKDSNQKLLDTNLLNTKGPINELSDESSSQEDHITTENMSTECTTQSTANIGETKDSIETIISQDEERKANNIGFLDAVSSQQENSRDICTKLTNLANDIHIYNYQEISDVVIKENAYDIVEKSKSEHRHELPQVESHDSLSSLTDTTNKVASASNEINKNLATCNNPALQSNNLTVSKLSYDVITSEDSHSVDSDSNSTDLSSRGQSTQHGSSDTTSSEVKEFEKRLHQMSIEELREVALSNHCERTRMRENIKSLRKSYHEEVDNSLRLRGELEKATATSSLTEEMQTKRVTSLTREVEMLKNQLKKYVSAVQHLRREIKEETPITKQALTGIRQDTPISVPETQQSTVYSVEQDSYEQKLVQVAEMCGELLEFNEMLQRQIQRKDISIHRMKEELINLRGPMPLSQESEDPELQELEVKSVTRPLVNIWIPSAFLRKLGSETYYVYQVYVRIGDEEWNIYRRYAQFYKFWKAMKRTYPSTAKLDFPPKNALKKMDPRFVKNRKERLQQYLRTAINTVIAEHRDLAQDVCKRKFIEVLSFFRDTSDSENSREPEITAQNYAGF